MDEGEFHHTTMAFQYADKCHRIYNISLHREKEMATRVLHVTPYEILISRRYVLLLPHHVPLIEVCVFHVPTHSDVGYHLLLACIIGRQLVDSQHFSSLIVSFVLLLIRLAQFMSLEILICLRSDHVLLPP